jgi:hypothetical protein
MNPLRYPSLLGSVKVVSNKMKKREQNYKNLMVLNICTVKNSGTIFCTVKIIINVFPVFLRVPPKPELDTEQAWAI